VQSAGKPPTQVGVSANITQEEGRCESFLANRIALKIEDFVVADHNSAFAVRRHSKDVVHEGHYLFRAPRFQSGFVGPLFGRIRHAMNHAMHE
jgi:hypothetical protein